jgi:hypothetical protein
VAKYKNVRSEERRALFRDVVKAINGNKTFSITATLNSEQYRKAFAGIAELSMYGACSANTWIMHRNRPSAAFDAVRLISSFALFY